MNDEHGFINRGAGIGGYNNMRKKIDLELRRRGYDPRLFTEGIVQHNVEGVSRRSAAIVGQRGQTVPAHDAQNPFRLHIMEFQNGDDNNPTHRSCEAHMLNVSKKRQYFGPGALGASEYPDFPKDSDVQCRKNLTGNPEEEVSDA